jgi:hypothetical protein
MVNILAMVSKPELLLLVVFALFSLADLRYREAPGVAAVYLGALYLETTSDPLRAASVALAVIWGHYRTWPGMLAWPALLHPAAWVVVLAGYGVRMGVVGRGDLLAAGALACLFPWPAPVLAFLGVELWRRLWVRRGLPGPLPALPGMFMGLAAYLFFWRVVPALR